MVSGYVDFYVRLLEVTEGGFSAYFPDCRRTYSIPASAEVLGEWRKYIGETERGQRIRVRLSDDVVHRLDMLGDMLNQGLNRRRGK